MDKITLSGSPEEVGFQHGKILADQIHRNIAFYQSIFLSNLGEETKVLTLAESFKKQIEEFDPKYLKEIDHIALGADVSEPLWLYALNSRTELAITAGANECTAVVFPQRNLIGQTWDWAQHLENHSVIMEIEFPSGHRILQLTEAGIIGKIGLNNRGLGLTLNLLRIENRDLTDIPIHVLLRSVLESSTLEKAIRVIKRSGHGRASNIILAQAGRAFNVEFIGYDTCFYEIEDDGYIHTNHILHAPQSVQIADISYTDSLGRYTTAVEKLSALEEFSLQRMVSILSDQSNDEYPVLASYEPHPIKEMGHCGTLATIVMDLTRMTMKVRQGNPSSPAFAMNHFDEYYMMS